MSTKAYYPINEIGAGKPGKQNEIMNANSEFKEDIEYVNKSLLSN